MLSEMPLRHKTSRAWAAVFVTLLLGTPALAKDKFVTLGTGSPNGTYTPVGEGICQLVKDLRVEHGVRCIAYNTGGSV